ncbi:MAG: twin-arginine translocase TatA/TatE family subunit [Aggregatilineales bacterium]
MHLPQGFEIVILLVIVLVLFGAGRVGKLGGELGQAIREFRKGMSSDETTPTPTTPPPTAPTSDPTKLPPANL